MVFSSTLFLFYFLPLALGLYYACGSRGRAVVLTGLSYVFYGWANPWFVLLMLFSTAVDYGCGKLVAPPGDPPLSERRRRLGVTISVVVNLALLGVFKYLGFAQENLNLVLEWFGAEALAAYRVALPVGISFYTFQSMSYTIDLYRGHARPARSFVEFACYVSMFPQLVAGPIVRYQEVAGQLCERSHTVDKFSRGVLFFAIGLGKKILLANPMGEVADTAFAAAELTTAQAWAGALAYAFQIYFDFSGYSDMAVGLGLMFGFELPRNFNRPYLADSITDFWRRWHISLSTWLRDYLYVPLGGNRGGAWRTYRNLALVMLLGGLWHGASWTFVVWGAIHGTMLIAERLMGRHAIYRNAPRALRIAFTFLVVLVTWVFFRAESFGQAGEILAAMGGWSSAGATAALTGSLMFSPDRLLMLAACAAIVWAAPDTWEIVDSPLTVRKGFAVAGLFLAATAVMFTQSHNPFLYFRF